ncbi:Invasion associated locus B family protein [Xaviernesmea oryzae]|uniref:Invasion associated locus B family protein n=1 Tax=Xaviernesmea oryzae TaxID=464029 RepID=A0A1Q9AWN9_9HYPH|nr:invasion associated locus B family protein [Xaviernesmea oryzae]OLP59838.1 Invasion associated locus B family protein [Xaviernesmea oryzae]SEK49656.1 Invasion protein IalB, involved in pathogenesis [Xaviernesmea oryzae]
MTFKSTLTQKAALAAIAGAVAAATMPAAAFAQDAGGRPPQGWFKVCTKQEDNDVCIVQNLLTANNGQLITAAGLITVTGKVNRKILQVSVPSARMIPPGIQVQIDGGKPIKLDYAICMPDKCVAEAPLTDPVIASLKKGTEVVFTSVNFQRAPNPIKMSLEGFTGVFDGEPIEQSKLQERQRLLQEEMQKKADDARKKLEEAQKAAKQN